MAAQLSRRVLRSILWFVRATRLALEDPIEGLDRALVRVRRSQARGPDPADADQGWEERLHALMGAPWPCPAKREFDLAFSDVVELLRERGLPVGRAAYGGWDDADPAFARAVWCLTSHLAPKTVVETGVARGVTTRFILQALERNRSGHLWSVDRPPLERRLHAEIGAAVPAHLRHRWTLLRGTSRKILPDLLHRISPIDLFVHDSLHTDRNLRFELTWAWRAMGGRGVIVADDVERNAAFPRFVEGISGLESLVAPADDGRSCFGIVLPARAGGIMAATAESLAV
jgi:predicted O-methyltransferase YrrM